MKERGKERRGEETFRRVKGKDQEEEEEWKGEGKDAGESEGGKGDNGRRK